MKNYPAVLFEQAEPELGISGSTLAVQALMVAFGLSFSCGACTMTIPAGGWQP